jgi:hypothetical protein
MACFNADAVVNHLLRQARPVNEDDFSLDLLDVILGVLREKERRVALCDTQWFERQPSRQVKASRASVPDFVWVAQRTPRHHAKLATEQEAPSALSRPILCPQI